VEVFRPPSDLPAAMPRAHAGTLRMAQAPRSASEALAATPLPVPTATVRLVTPAPAAIHEPILPPPEARGSMSPFAQTALAPIPSANPPPILYPVASRAPQRPRTGGPGILLLVVLVVLLGAIAGGWWALFRHEQQPV